MQKYLSDVMKQFCSVVEEKCTRICTFIVELFLLSIGKYIVFDYYVISFLFSLLYNVSVWL